MTTGRKPKPAAQHKLEGTFRHHRHGGAEPAAAPGAPEPPDCLDQAARQEWERVCAELANMGILAKADLALLAAYAGTWSTWCQAQAQLAETGPVVRTASGSAAASPFFSVAMRCAGELRALAAELGLSPTSRARLRVQNKAELDLFAEFLHGPRLRTNDNDDDADDDAGDATEVSTTSSTPGAADASERQPEAHNG